MRYPNGKRILMIGLMLPVFILLLLWHNIFLLLDHILFPGFKKRKLNQPTFIIAAPRSGTTHLFHNLASRREEFTSIKLWEIILAPSIIQKYILIALHRFDILIGHPITRIIKKLDRIAFRKISGIHPISLFQPEEDEALMLWSLESLYLNFFYPDSHYFDGTFNFDLGVPVSRRSRIMRAYRRYILRHDFVFNRGGQKQFVSKNPLMMCKVQSLSLAFPNALILNINRCPAKVLPSSIALNNLLYSLFTSIPAHEEVNQRTMDVLINWYQLCENGLNSAFPRQHLKIDFKKMVSNDPEELKHISSFLNIDLDILKVESGKNKKRNEYDDLSAEDLESLLNTLPFLSPYCK